MELKFKYVSKPYLFDKPSPDNEEAYVPVYFKADVDAALALARREVLEDAATMASNHTCGGEDDIICQHHNCAAIIEGTIRAHAATEPHP